MPIFHPKEVFQQAQEAEKLGQSAQAAAHYASLSVYLRRRGKHAEALALIRKALKLEPGYAKLHLQLAICEKMNSNGAAAHAAMLEFTQHVLNQAKVEQFRPVAERLLADHPELRQVFFDGILKLDRTAAPAFLGRADSLSGQGKPLQALKVLLEALQTRTEEEKVVDSIEALLRKAGYTEALLQVGRYRQGRISMDNLIVLLSSLEKPTEREEPSLLTAEKPLKALIEELEKEMGLDLGNPQDEIAPLLAEFRKRSGPILGQDARALMDMGLAYYEMGLFREAKDEISKIQEQDPLFGQAQSLLGQVYIAEGSELAALDAFQKCLRAPGRNQDIENEARYQLAHVFFRLGDLRRAFAYVAELEKAAPQYRDLRVLKGQIQEALESSSGGSE